MLSMTVGAGWRIPIPVPTRDSVDALLIDIGSFQMTMGTGVGNISLVDRRSRIARLLQIMSAVAITAGGRLLIAGCELDPMDAFLITRDESGRVSDGFRI